ncbi:MAG: SCO family protein [Anaplasma sp.]
MKIFKIVSNLLLLVAAAFLGYSYVNKKGIFGGREELVASDVAVEPGVATISASFGDMVNHEGMAVDSSVFSGKNMLVIFGFSACQQTCPAELGMASSLLSRLGDSAGELQVVFITIDPKNDTVDRLREYHKSFDSRIQMLTGSEEAIESAIQNYKVFVGATTGVEGVNKNIDHSTFMYFINKKGEYVAHFSPDFDSSDDQGEKLFKFVSSHMLNS